MSVAADRGKSRSQFHRSLPNTFAGNLEDLQTYSKQCLSALNTMCQASGHLAETFAALFHDTSLAEAALRMQEVSHDLGSRTQDASTQVEEDVTTMLNRIVNKGTNEKSEEAVQTLARCFLLMLQTQYHFFQTAADLHAPLSRYQELEDLFIGEECQPEVRDACSSWMSASQLTRPLRRGDTLTSDEVNLLETERGKPSSDNPKLIEARRKLESQSMIYKHEIAILPQTSFALLGGFHLHLQCLSMLLRSCCSPSEAQDIINRHGSSQLAAMAMGIGSQSTVGQTQPQVNQQEWFEAVCRELKTTTLQVDGTLCRQTSNTEEDFNIKMKTINNLVKDLAAHLGLMVDVQSITAQIVSHACSSLAHLHSQTAVQLLFGRAYVVTARAAEVSDPYKRYAQVTSQEGAILVEVPSVWDLVMVGGAGLQGVCPEVQENNNAGTGKQSEQQKQQQQQQQSSGLGACEVVYSAKIDLMDVVERRRISLPIIQVKLVKKDITITVTGPHTSMSSSSMTSTTQSESLSSPSGMKRTIEKLVSKFRQRVPISKATPMASSSPSSSSSSASRSAFYLPISQLEVQAAVGVGGGVSPGNQSHTACSSLLSSPSISSGSSTMSSNSSLYERETPDSDAPKNVKMVSGEKIKPESKEFEGKSPMVGPTVTITSEPSPVEEKNHWETSIMRQHDLTRTKKGLASDSVLADLVNLLSGVRARSSSHLDPATQGNKSHHDSVTRTSSSSSTSSQGGGGGWGGRGDSGENINRFGNYNPSFQEGDLIDRIQEHHGSMWPVKGFHHQSLHQGQQDMPHRRTSFDNNNEAEFANYVAMNQLGKRSKRYGDNLNVSQQQHQGHSPQLSPRPHQKQQQWSVGSVKEEGPMSKTWPSSDVTLERNENLNNTWSNPAHDSGSSSDEASNSGENPSTLMSMVHSSPTGPGLLTPVSRRRHSSGEDTLHGKPFCPSPEPSMHYLDVIPMDKNSTKTWPPKMVWQRPNSPQPPTLGTGAPPGGAGSLGGSANQLWHHQSPSREHLNVHAPLTPQWSDPLSLRQPSVWAPSSTPVSPSGSMNTIPTSSAATSHSQGASPNLSVRGHPKLDRRYAYTYH